MILDEGAPHRDSLAKKTVAFSKISRSIRSRSTSARSLRISSPSPVYFPNLANAESPSAANSSLHLRSRPSPTSRHFATSPTLRPGCLDNRTDPTLNSRETSVADARSRSSSCTLLACLLDRKTGGSPTLPRTSCSLLSEFGRNSQSDSKQTCPPFSITSPQDLR